MKAPGNNQKDTPLHIPGGVTRDIHAPRPKRAYVKYVHFCCPAEMWVRERGLIWVPAPHKIHQIKYQGLSIRRNHISYSSGRNRAHDASSTAPTVMT